MGGNTIQLAKRFTAAAMVALLLIGGWSQRVAAQTCAVVWNFQNQPAAEWANTDWDYDASFNALFYEGTAPSETTLTQSELSILGVTTPIPSDNITFQLTGGNNGGIFFGTGNTLRVEYRFTDSTVSSTPVIGKFLSELAIILEGSPTTTGQYFAGIGGVSVSGLCSTAQATATSIPTATPQITPIPTATPDQSATAAATAAPTSTRFASPLIREGVPPLPQPVAIPPIPPEMQVGIDKLWEFETLNGFFVMVMSVFALARQHYIVQIVVITGVFVLVVWWVVGMVRNRQQTF